MLTIILFYQTYLSPLFGRHCRFYPTCSHYFYEAVSKAGLVKGTLRGLSRILRCHPFSAGGFDPVTK
ncbi:MAG: membrane protein insertion efficiency factor YidD [Candidatus Omnitrophota bacterium]